MKASSLSFRDAVLALAIMAVWGTNFVVAHIALTVLPPLLFAALRFTFVLLPLVFFLPRPRSAGDSRSAPEKVSWGNLAGYGLAIGMGQFGLLFIAMNGMISAGLASLVVQMQVFFTIALSIWRASARGAMTRNAERLGPHQIVAFVLAIAGMGVIFVHNGHDATMPGVILTLGAAASWALGNQFAKEAGQVEILSYVVWASLFSVVPLYGLSLFLEGPAAILNGLRHAGAATWIAVLWQSTANTMFGYGCWAWLLARYPAATVAPMSLLVPVFGMAASAFWLGEPLEVWKLAATALVMAGVAINLLWRPRAAGQ
jgi:O-acetylserine/cysteine efflux transporter